MQARGGMTGAARSSGERQRPPCPGATRAPARGAARGWVGGDGALSDDCFAFSGPLLPVDEAERTDRRAGERRSPRSRRCRSRPRMAACSRDDVVAPIDLPPFDNSAVDGYAVRPADLDAGGETRLAVVGRVAAGPRRGAAARGGRAIRIFTGAPMPAGADTVFMQEDVPLDGEAVSCRRARARRQPPPRRRGLRAGAVVLPAGRRLTRRTWRWRRRSASRLPVRRARAGRGVFDRRRDRRARHAARPAALFDANRYLLAGLLDGWARRPPISASCATTGGAGAGDRGGGARTISCSPRAAYRPARPTTSRRGRGDRQAGVLAASASSRAGRSRWACQSRRRRRLRGPAGQSGRGVRDLRARGAAALRGSPARVRR